METTVSRPRVLVLEDEAIIAVDIEGILTDAGLAVAGTIPTCAEALEWLAINTADVALLDLHLLDGSCEPVARRLVDQRIPFVVFSGGDEGDATLDPIFASGAWLDKPAPPDRIVAAVRGALGPQA